VKNVAPIQPVLKQADPVEVPPGAKLQINQHGQNQKDDGRGCVSFFIHSVLFHSALLILFVAVLIVWRAAEE
jgi:hypothetical protein